MTTRDCMAWRRLFPAMCMLILRIAAVAQHQPIITTIDARLAGTTNGYGTEVEAINRAGMMMTGFYVGYDNVVHAFVGKSDDHLTPIDGPGVPSSLPDVDDPYSPPSNWLNTNAPGTYGAAINAEGTMTGYYVDAGKVAHGFLRSRDGEFTHFDVKDAGNQPGQGTFAVNLNREGTIAGYYVDGSGGAQGFLHQCHSFGDRFAIPARAVLIRQQNQLCRRRGPRRATGFLQQHQRKQPNHLRLWLKLGQHSAQSADQ